MSTDYNEEQTNNEPVNNTTAEEQQNVAYPDISKANTKTIVIISLICIVLIFFLSVFFPDKTKDNTNTTSPKATTEQSVKDRESTEDITTTEGLLDMGLLNNLEPNASADTEAFSFTPLSEAAPGFCTINGNTYYLVRYSNHVTGWMKINRDQYYFDKNGIMATGWKTIAGKEYYFHSDGSLAANEWIDERYIGEDGYVLTSTLTPDNIYVDSNGYANDSLGTTGSREGLAPLRSTLQNMLSGYSGTWSVYVKDLNANEYLSINNIQYFSASLIKLYCAAAAYDLMDKGELEETASIDSLMTQMLSISDNDAFNLMVMRCAPDNSHITGRGIIQDYIDREGYTDTTITSILVPTKYKAPSSAGRNLTTVNDCGLLMEKIYKGKCVSPEYSEKFLELLLNQTHINKIPAGLPAGPKCANKTGDTDEFQHDAAIVYSPATDYIICVMSTNCGAAIPNIQKISSTVYNYFNHETSIE